MTRSGIFSALGLLLFLAATSNTARAQGGYPYGNGGGYGYWYGSPYSFYQEEHVPYYALHPPVYYSLPVPRTYGYSPFAYPPGTMTPDLVDGGAAEFHNPYVPEKPAPRETKPKTRTKGTSGKAAGLDKMTSVLVIDNPYFVRKSVAKSQ